MKLTHEDIRDLQVIAELAALKAGKLVQEKRADFTVNFKSAGESLASTVVTEVDLMSEEIINQVLGPTLSKYDLALLSEETPDDGSRLQKDYFWCIDPIDGTLPFTKQQEGYAVTISMIDKAGVPIIGVAYDPWNEKLYAGSTVQPLTINGTPFVLPNSSRHFLFFTDLSFTQHPAYDHLVQAYRSFAMQRGYSFEVKEDFGAVINACQLLESGLGVYLKFPKPQKGGGSYWDYGCTACYYHQLSLPVTASNGAPMQLNLPHSTYMNEQGILFATDHEIAQLGIELYRNWEG